MCLCSSCIPTHVRQSLPGDPESPRALLHDLQTPDLSQLLCWWAARSF